MTCQQELMAVGMPYPRTCHECGLGPCKSLRPKAQDDTALLRQARNALMNVQEDQHRQRIEYQKVYGELEVCNAITALRERLGEAG